MLQSDVTALLADDLVAEAFQDADQVIGRNVPWQLHAASTGISSSLT
jgi:hypothetical protein